MIVETGIIKKDYKNRCWWCGNLADSREHKHKKTDFKRLYTTELTEGKLPVVDKDKKFYQIQGPDSDLLKYDKVLCQKCNNSRSQSFDRAYDKFIEYFDDKIDVIIQDGYIDFEEIFPDDYELEKYNTIRYYIKHFCCKLASNNIMIDEKIIDFLNSKTNTLNSVLMKFEIRYDKYILEKLQNKVDLLFGLNIGPLTFSLNHDNNQYKWLSYSYDYKCLRVNFTYSKSINQNNYPNISSYYKKTKFHIDTLFTLDPEEYQHTTYDQLIKKLIPLVKNEIEVGSEEDVERQLNNLREFK